MKTTFLNPPSFRKTLLASLLIPLFSVSSAWAENTLSVIDGTTKSVTGDYDSAIENGYAIEVGGANSTVNSISGLVIDTTGRNTTGIKVTEGGALNLTGSSITTHGIVASGISNSKGTVNLHGGTITTSGDTARGIYSTGVGSKTILDGTTITATGNGIEGWSGTEISLTNTHISTDGGSLKGVYLTGTNSTLTGDGNNFNNTGYSGTSINLSSGANGYLTNTTAYLDNGYAVASVAKGSTLTLDGLNVTGKVNQVLEGGGTFNLSNAEIHLDSGAVVRVIGNATNLAKVTLTNVNATSQSGNATMINVNTYADVTVIGGSYLSKGDNAIGIWVPGKDSKVQVTNSQIYTEGYGASAIENRGTAVVDSTTVGTKGGNAHGIYSEYRFDATNMAISTAGVGSVGATAARGGVLNLDSASIDTTGDSGMVIGTFASSTVDAKNVIGTSTGASAYALWTQTSSNINLENSRITTQGVNAGGIYAAGSAAVYTNVDLNNSSVISTLGSGLRAYGANINTDVRNGSILSGGNGILIDAATNVGTVSSPLNIVSNVNMTVDNQSTVVGDIRAAENNVVNLSLTGNSVWSGAAINANSIDIDETSLWNLTGDVDVQSLNMAGNVVFLPSSTSARASSSDFSTLTINGNLSGGGNFTLNGALGDNDSVTDKIHVMGDVTGDYGVRVMNRGGLGALTTGNGINLISVDGDASAGQFAMNGSVSAGAYDYYLYKIDDNHWNLQSNLTPEPPEPPEPPVPPLPPEPPLPPLPPKPEIAYRTEVSGYIAAPYLNEFYGFTILGSLHERRGDSASYGSGFSQGAWGRISGQHNNFDAGRFSYDSDIWFAQMGSDLYQSENAAGTQTTAGMMMTLGTQHTNTQDRARSVRAELSVNTGKIKTDAYGLGGYYTIMTNDGGYIDLVGQGTFYRNSYESRNNADQNGYGLAMSAEVGKAFNIADGWSIEPQGQLKYQYLNLESFSDDISDISGTSHSVGQARGGFRLYHDGGKEQVIKPYLSSDVIYQLGKDPKVTVDTATIRPDFSESYWQGGVGVTAKVGQGVDVYADARYQKAFDGQMDGYSGNLGIKVSF